VPLVTTGSIVTDARSAATGAGAFNVLHLESAEAIVRGAEAAQRPVIMQISENCVRYHGALEPILAATLAVARHAAIPVSVHLDHAETPALIDEAVALGVSSVMYDGSRLAYADNVATTHAIVERCHRAGTWVEAELGEVGGKDGAHAPGVRTDPDEAADFVRRTGVDALAVAVGSSHAMTTRDARLDETLIRTIAAATPVPLVLHGSSGVDTDGLRAAVGAGMTKINLSTRLNQAFTAGLRDHLGANPAVVDSRRYLGAARDAMAGEVEHLLRALASTPEERSWK